MLLIREHKVLIGQMGLSLMSIDRLGHAFPVGRHYWVV